QSVHAPDEVKGTGTSGETTYSVTPATSTLTATVNGPVSSPLTKGTLTGTAAETYYEVNIPAGTKASQITIHFDPAADTIVGVVWGRMVDGVPQDGAFADPDSNGTSTISLRQPNAGKLFVAVIAVGSTDDTVTPYTYQVNNITEDSPVTGKVTVTPDHARVTPGTPTDLTATWSGVPAGARSTVWIEYPNGAGTLLTLN
ncbi:serine protease, partial [Streptomyces sp. NPDC050256]